MRRDPILDALAHALHMVSGAGARWATRRVAGLTDDQLRGAIAEEFGIYQGASGWRGPTWGAFGGEKPALYLGEWSHVRKGPKLEGAALIDATRRLLSIPQPPTVAEQTSFL